MDTVATRTNAAPTLVTSPDPDGLSPLEAAIMDLCNLMHDAAGAGDHVRITALLTEAEGLLHRYEVSGAEDHPNPAWAVPNQRALVLSAAGEVAGAIDLELLALPHADTATRQEISLGNLCERSIRLEDFDQAVEFFLRAHEVAPGSVPIMMTGAQALHLAGYRTEAHRIFRSIADQASSRPEMLARTGELASYLDCEPRLLAIAPDQPALAELMTTWQATVTSQT